MDGQIDLSAVTARYEAAVRADWAMPDAVRASWRDVPDLVAGLVRLQGALEVALAEAVAGRQQGLIGSLGVRPPLSVEAASEALDAATDAFRDALDREER